MEPNEETVNQIKQLLQSLGGGVVINNLTINVQDLQVGDRAVLNEAPRRKAGPDELYCVKCNRIMPKASFQWIVRNRLVYCTPCARSLILEAGAR